MTIATPVSSLCPRIEAAATTFVRAIMAPMERSIPPDMTTMAWATAASARGAIEMANPWMPVTP